MLFLLQLVIAITAKIYHTKHQLITFPSVYRGADKSLA